MRLIFIESVNISASLNLAFDPGCPLVMESHGKWW